MKTSVLTVRLPSAVKKELASLAKMEGAGVSDLVRESLEPYLAVKRFRSLRRKILPFAEAQGILTDEDIFKAIS